MGIGNIVNAAGMSEEKAHEKKQEYVLVDDELSLRYGFPPFGVEKSHAWKFNKGKK